MAVSIAAPSQSRGAIIACDEAGLRGLENPDAPLVTPVKRVLLKEWPVDSGVFEVAVSAKDKDWRPQHVPVSPLSDTVRLTLEIESAGAGLCVERTMASCVGMPLRDTCAP